MNKKILFISLLFISIVMIGSRISVNAQDSSQLDDFSASSYAEYYSCENSEIELYELENYDGYIKFGMEKVYVNVLNVLTPNNSPVEVYHTLNDISINLINSYNNYYDRKFDEAIRKSSATGHYNCHSYAWYSQSTSTNNYWMNDPSNYYADNGYIEVSTPRKGDIICYFDNNETPDKIADDKNLHSGIVIEYYSSIASNNICGTADKVKVESKWGPAGVYEHFGDYCPYTSTYGGAADYVRYFRPNTNASYSLANYSSTINDSLTVDSNTPKIDSYEMYELDVNHTKYYEFNINSSNDNILDVRLYDEHMQLMNILELDNDSNKVHFIEQLYNAKIYYLRVAYVNEYDVGTINTEIISRNTAYLSPGINNILVNTYNDISEYYVSVTESGFYELKIIGNTSNGNSITYPNECIKLYEDNDHEIFTDKYQLDDYTYNAISIGNRLFVYLSSNKYYYLKLELSDLEYSSLSLSITKEETLEYDFSNNLAFGMFEELFNTNQVDDYLKKINISHRSLFTLDALTFNEVSSNIKVLILKEEYNPNLKQTYLEETFIYEITPNNSSPEFNFILEAGTYYFGYIENISSVTIKYVLERIIDTSVDIYNTLVADPNYIGYDLGSEVRYNNGLCDNYIITEGFTRNMYVMVEDRNTQSISRLDYDWYSSNDDIAIVTSYGTVLAKNVDTNIEVKIYAMLKEDPSIVYEKTFTIINDESVTPIEITSNMSYSYSELNGEYKLELNTNNSIFPYIQYYTWEIEENELNVNMDNWGFISSNGTGTVVIIGSYIYNPRVTIIINLTILE